MKISEIMTHTLVVGMGIALLVHLSLIAIYKEVLIREPMAPVLILEMIFMASIIVFGIYNLIVAFRAR